MSLFTDPINNSGFPESWTIFFMAFFTNYCGMMGIFMAKISKGRTIGQFAVCSLGGMTGGTIFLFGTLGSFSINSFLTGKANVLNLVTSGEGQSGIYKILQLLPGGKFIVPLVLVIIIVGFVASSLDTASLGLAQTTTRTVDAEGNASKWLRVFWCFILALVPLVMMYVHAGFDPIKQISILASVPFMFVMALLVIGLFKWLKQDELNGVLDENKKMRDRELKQWAQEKLEAKIKKQEEKQKAKETANV